MYWKKEVDHDRQIGAYLHVACVRDAPINTALAVTGHANVVSCFALPCGRRCLQDSTPKTEMRAFRETRMRKCMRCIETNDERFAMAVAQ
jgi:hypothetical protein